MSNTIKSYISNKVNGIMDDDEVIASPSLLLFFYHHGGA